MFTCSCHHALTPHSPHETAIWVKVMTPNIDYIFHSASKKILPYVSVSMRRTVTQMCRSWRHFETACMRQGEKAFETSSEIRVFF